MKTFKLLIILLTFTSIFTACDIQQQNDFKDVTAEDILEGKTWSESDPIKENYVIREFYQNQFIEKHYATNKFKELIDTKNNKILKYNEDSIDTEIDGVHYKCAVCSDSSEEAITFSCDPLDVGGETSCTTLWRK